MSDDSNGPPGVAWYVLWTFPSYLLCLFITAFEFLSMDGHEAGELIFGAALLGPIIVVYQSIIWAAIAIPGAFLIGSRYEVVKLISLSIALLSIIGLFVFFNDDGTRLSDDLTILPFSWWVFALIIWGSIGAAAAYRFLRETGAFD